MKKTLYPMALAFALLATSCANDDIFNINDADKDMISFSLSDGSRESRAGFTGAATRIVARFQSDATSKNTLYTRTILQAAVGGAGADDYSVVSYPSNDNKRYWDDAYGRKANISVYAVAIPNSTDNTKLKEELLTGGSNWANEATPNNNIVWDVTKTAQTADLIKAEDLVYSNNIQTSGKNGRYVWDFDATTPGYPADNGKLDGHKDGCLVFTQKSGAAESDAGHFDKGHLMFNHSLSRLTVTLKEDEGYNTSSDADFKFNSGTGNIKLLKFPTNGTLNIQTGKWANYTTTNITDISQMAGSTTTANNETFSAQMLPGYKYYDGNLTNVMQFVIDNNTYYITQDMVFDALNTTENTTGTTPKVVVENDTNGDYIEMKQGKNYQLTIKVKKTKIDNITATLAPWDEVTGSLSVNNAHINLSLKTTGATCDKNIDLYRLGDDNPSYDADNYNFSYKGKNWFGNYTTDDAHKTPLAQSAIKSDNTWETPWFYESNKTYYHFRTVNSGTTVKGNTDATNDYFEIAAGPTATTDPHWGAPMQSSSTTWLKYDETKGYEDHLHHAIGATEDQVAIQELHMMSNINVVLQTTNDGGKVMLYDDTTDPSHPVGTIVKITRLAKNGTVEMGRGLVTALAPTTPETWASTEVTMTAPATTSAADYFTSTGVTNRTQSKTYSYAVVPQWLSRDNTFASTNDDDYVGIFIQTPDHNQYYVVKKLSDIVAETVSDERNQTKGDKIHRWYPGHSYTYTFTITKTEIKNVTCTVADWVTVTGKDTNLTLED